MSDRASVGAEDWALPQSARPPLLGELVERIDEALATARASEAAVMSVGAAALDAADQARRAAELAERASAVMTASLRSTGPTPANGGLPQPPPADAEEMGDFNARADRVAERLRRLQGLALSA
jgi:hypothetical protein